MSQILLECKLRAKGVSVEAAPGQSPTAKPLWPSLRLTAGVGVSWAKPGETNIIQAWFCDCGYSGVDLYGFVLGST